MTEKCPHHEAIAHRTSALESKIARIEMGIVLTLCGIIGQLWLLWDLPGQIRADRAKEIVATANAEEGRK